MTEVVCVTRKLEFVQVNVPGEAAFESGRDPLRRRSALAVLGGVVLEGNRRNHDGDSRRGTDPDGDRQLVEIGADVVEALGRKRKHFPRGHIGRIENQEWLAALVELRECFIVEQLRVE